MFIVQLRFSEHRDKAKEYMDAHNAWLRQGFDDGVFLLAGSLDSGMGGGILAHGASRQALEQRVQTDPFVVEGVVTAEVVELAPAKADPRLEFLLAG
ncbi:MAG: YciI family protein [Alcanivorax sediminis]|uniref:YCII-related domain-containing protein n=1 Tax=Alcanivorax sediminis TaxID=2663008 RepID=A0A6N7LTQ1_9GAMM|nr:YciI family protein [Alcanivorax sediminis]MQX53662.1 hypothetical protein [Alcanivorax sediminis]